MSVLTSSWLLPLLCLLPLAAAGVLWLLPARLAREIAALGLLLTLAVAVAAVVAFVPGGPRFQLLFEQPWVVALQVHVRLGVDGLSVLFLPATALLFGAALLSAWNEELHPELAATPRLHASLLLVLASLTLGVLTSLDTLLFFVCWELSLLPVYFLVGLRPGQSASGVAARYVLLMLAGGLALLLAVLLLASSVPATPFDLITLLDGRLPVSTQWAVFLLLLLGFGIKVPLVPLHTWLPQLALHTSGSWVALLVGLKLGAYGLLRLAIPLAPDVAQTAHWLLAGLGTLTVLYGAVGMLAQSNLRAALVMGGVSHVGLVVLGLSALNAQGVQGAVAMLLGFVLSAGGSLLVCAALAQRLGALDQGALGGLAGRLPKLTVGFLICGLAGLGLPGTVGFPGELLVLLAVLQTHTGAGLGALFGLVIGVAAFLSLFRTAFLGVPKRSGEWGEEALQAREWAMLLVFLGLVFGLGFFPAFWLDRIAPAAAAWAAGL